MAVAALGGTSAAAVAAAAAAAAASSPFLCGGSFLLNSLLGCGSGGADSAAALRAPPVYPDAAATLSSELLQAAGISQPTPSTASSAEDETRVSVDTDSRNHRCFLETLSSLFSFPANPLAHQLAGRLAGPGRQ